MRCRPRRQASPCSSSTAPAPSRRRRLAHARLIDSKAMNLARIALLWGTAALATVGCAHAGARRTDFATFQDCVTSVPGQAARHIVFERRALSDRVKDDGG